MRKLSLLLAALVFTGCSALHGGLSLLPNGGIGAKITLKVPGTEQTLAKVDAESDALGVVNLLMDWVKGKIGLGGEPAE